MSSSGQLIKTKARVLVVDDDPVARDILVTVLSSDGYTVIVAKSAEDALETVLTEPVLIEGLPSGWADIDIALLDVLLPRISGLELAQKMRAGGFYGPLLFLTASRENELPSTLRDFRQARVLTKPFTAEEVLEQIADLLKTNDTPSI